ncbi:hypothetical protein MMC25_001234 [Agyrium rufum]|nr:hypothetical protein [Agyrium rufum]
MTSKKKRSLPQRPTLLSSTRPQVPTRAGSTSNPSSRSTRTLIRQYHTLEKRLAQAKRAQDVSLVSDLRAQLSGLGGLKSYQQASLSGQSAERGGDSSKVLMQWLEPYIRTSTSSGGAQKFRLLEVGALSPHNECSKSAAFDVTRIDLHSQHPSILTQDFMQRPLPSNGEDLSKDGFDVVSLSLVVNFVPDAHGRGEMLRRVGKFLRTTNTQSDPAIDADDEPLKREIISPFPCLFLVLPAPCVLNSRYLDEDRLQAMLESLGYALVDKKLAKKLVYYLWHLERRDSGKAFGKDEIRKGGARNNFAIAL